MEKKPVLSIGMIYKNEIRCLERCLKSLQPLRDAVPCELVMADTGSSDGSREIAEKYADILFDFPWINDFAAARNAVMDRCSGEWYFSIDADEWLDEDIKELTGFLTGSERKRHDTCGVMERNYYSYDTNGRYGVFIACRLLRMATGLRYEGALHEQWNVLKYRQTVLGKTLLHHDGYVEMNTDSAAGKEKLKRNISLLRKKLEEEPEDLRAHMQFIDSGKNEPDLNDKVRKMVSLVKKRVPLWDKMGAPAFSHAINHAKGGNFPEFEEWLQDAERLFPKSYFVRLDIAFTAAAYYLEKEDYAECARWGEKYLRAFEDYRAGRGDFVGQAHGSLQRTAPQDETAMKIVTARAYFETGREDEAMTLLSRLDYTALDILWTENLLRILQLIQYRGETGASSLISRVWEDIQTPSPSAEIAKERVESFFRVSVTRFDQDFIKKEERYSDFRRPAYTLYTPLKGRHVLGTAAAILESESAAEIEELMKLVDGWRELPIAALSHALQAGVQFPPAEQTVYIEEMDSLAAQLSKDPKELRDILTQAVKEDYTGSWQTLLWVRGLALAAVRVHDWKDESAGQWLARTFAKVERAFITGYYTPEVLREGNLFVLPPLHRFGWYCAQAFDALETGDIAGYARFLREGLAVNPGMKTMVEFLTEHTPELQAPPPSSELLALAEQVRTMLAAYPADDPAVAVLKASPAYRKVAYLIEGEGT